MFPNKDLDPNQNEFTKLIGDLNTRISSLERPRQILQGDWNPVNVGELTPVGVGQIDTGDQTQFLSIGDQIELVEGGVTKYFYITNIIGNVVTLYAGDNYTYSGGAVTAFKYSRAKNPVGHPIRFSESLAAGDFQAVDCTFTFFNGGVSVYMIGSQVFAEVSFYGVISAAGLNPTIIWKLPIQRINPSNIVLDSTFNPPIRLLNTAPVLGTVIRTGTISAGLEYRRADGSFYRWPVNGDFQTGHSVIYGILPGA